MKREERYWKQSTGQRDTERHTQIIKRKDEVRSMEKHI